MERRLTRSLEDRIVAGVCGGLGDYFGVEPVLVRLGWVLFTLVGGSGLLAYLIAWLVIPDELGRRAPMPVALLILLLLAPMAVGWLCAVTAMLMGFGH